MFSFDSKTAVKKTESKLRQWRLSLQTDRGRLRWRRDGRTRFLNGLLMRGRDGKTQGGEENPDFILREGPFLRNRAGCWNFQAVSWWDVSFHPNTDILIQGVFSPSVARFERWLFGKFPRPAGWYCSYLLPRQAIANCIKIHNNTSRQTGKNAL